MPHPESHPPTINRVKLVWAMGIAQILAWSTTYYLPAVLESLGSESLILIVGVN